ncbi:MAG TPA: HIT domain-containing protein [Candidatus Paceibacterota bacterium]|nr:HIT domain-containing protein [Candidatus Paceibacterota bacterium]
MIDDVFCKIIKGELKTDEVYRDDDVLVIRDIKPQAPVHLLVMPIEHVDGVSDASPELLGKLIATAHKVAQREGLTRGYRLILNEGEHGGKLVPHLHIHLLGGKPLGAKIVA